MTPFTKQVAENIRICRIFRKLSQENVADMLQMSVTGYGKIERGGSNITLVRFEAIAKILSVTPIQLLTFCDLADDILSEKNEQ